MKRLKKTTREIRDEAERLARIAAAMSDETGDREGADALFDLAKSIAAIRLTRDIPR